MCSKKWVHSSRLLSMVRMYASLHMDRQVLERRTRWKALISLCSSMSRRLNSTTWVEYCQELDTSCSKSNDGWKKISRELSVSKYLRSKSTVTPFETYLVKVLESSIFRPTLKLDKLWSKTRSGWRSAPQESSSKRSSYHPRSAYSARMAGTPIAQDHITSFRCESMARQELDRSRLVYSTL